MTDTPASLISPTIHESDRRFDNLRSVRWRVNLGVLPSPASSIDEFRRVTANSRRRYASLRRQLLIDPHVPKDSHSSSNLSIDNPLSQNPDSTWGRFFRNAELEKTLDQDLSRLYPEHGSYFQAPGFQGMLRRILLMWCLKRPEYGYKQGMHELLAPLLYVLHVDVGRLSEVRKSYEDHFTDRFDDLSFEERDVIYNFDFKKFLDSMEDEIGSKGSLKKMKRLDELDPEIQSIVMLSDAYGAEGELGVVLSEKFMEHDAYCMFDALMSGPHGSISVSDFFAYSPAKGSQTGLPPVLEACAGFYHLLSVVDSSLHSHLVELGVEPQYFGLRWLRVLFGREFSLQDLLIVWDEIFSAADNVSDNRSHTFRIFDSPRGALIAGMAVSMILYLRSSLLATETATSCLQRLLNFPESIDLGKIIDKAKSLQVLAMDDDDDDNDNNNDVRSVPSINSPVPVRTNSLPSGSVSPKSPLIITPESYWEEKWRVLHRAEEAKGQNSQNRENSGQKKRVWSKVKDFLRKETDPSTSKNEDARREDNSSFVKRNLLEDLSEAAEEEEETNEDLTDEDEESPPLDTSFLSAGEESVGNERPHSEEDNNSSVSSAPTSPSVVDSSCPVPEHKKLLPGKFQWFWKLGRSFAAEEGEGCNKKGIESGSCASGSQGGGHNKGEADQKVMNTLRSLGQSMLEHIQVIESVFQQERVEKGQLTALTALKELRKLSNMLSEM